MKILIIGSGFTGSTLPLANRLTNMGHEVKFYNFVQWSKKSIESIDFENISFFHQEALCCCQNQTNYIPILINLLTSICSPAGTVKEEWKNY